MSHLKIDDQSDAKQLAKYTFVRLGAPYYLHPGGFVLGATLEWIRMPKKCAGYVVGKSSWGRRGLIIATAAGVHPCFCGCLTLELSNVGEAPVEIRPGMTICQLFVHSVEGETAAPQSNFGSKRRPVLGRIEPDDVAGRLTEWSKITTFEEESAAPD